MSLNGYDGLSRTSTTGSGCEADLGSGTYELCALNSGLEAHLRADRYYIEPVRLQLTSKAVACAHGSEAASEPQRLAFILLLGQ
jgi:hypothetical protein